MTPTSASVVARLTSTGQKVRLQVSQSASLTSAVFSALTTTADIAGNTVTLSVQGLLPDTDYYYGVEVAGALRDEEFSRGRFHTFPLGRGSFKIAFASCGDFRAANQSAYDAILAERPLLFINTGDLHYSDINSTQIDDYRKNYDAVLSQKNQAALYRGIPVAYMWDDHDFCGNDSDGTAIGRDTARAAFRERVPHYPIATGVGGAIAQSFTVGRVRVIMTDLRSASAPASQAESASKSRMGSSQKTWFKQELIAARDAGFPLILWVCTDPWIAPAAVGDDTWAGYATERTEIADFIKANHVSNVVLACGDMHALAYDDGTHSDYATGGGAPLTVLHAAALTSAGAIKGGPYTGAALPGSQQYGILEINDNGGPSVQCRFLGMRAGEGAKLSYIFGTTSPVTGSDQALVNISTLARVVAGDDMLVSGFVISGKVTRNVLIRAIGPTLAEFGLTDALEKPLLSVYRGDKLIASNEAWGTENTANRLSEAFDRAGAFRLGDRTSRDAALLLKLAPGSYTLQVKSADGSPGAALVEVYDVQ